MNDRSSFESRLKSTLATYVSAAPIEVDAAALSATIAGRERQTMHVLGLRFVKPRWLTPLLLAALLILATAAALLVGAQLLRTRAPVYPPLTIQPAAFMSQQRGGATAVRLIDGQVLIVGGDNGYAGGNSSYAEIYDPVTRTFTPTGSAPPINVRGQAATLLHDGHVLITGGYDDFLKSAPTALLFDPQTSEFASLPTMTAARANHASVVLGDGRVALVGGASDLDTEAAAIPAVEYFDPFSLTFSAGPDAAALRRASLAAFAIGSSRIVLLERGAPLKPVVFDTARGTVETVASPDATTSRTEPVVDAAQTPDGTIVVAVGNPKSKDEGSAALVELDAHLAVSVVHDLPGPVVVGPVSLNDGRVLVGIPNASDCTNVFAYVYSVSDDLLTPVGQIAGIGACTDPPSATVTSLDDGSALIAGGYMSYGGETSAASLIHP